MRQVNLVRCEPDSLALRELESLFLSEWSDFTFHDYDVSLPSPLAAVAAPDLEVVGGLAYAFYRQADIEMIWINALYVLPEFRGNGIASKLIKKAMLEVMRLGQAKLLAYTHIPELYRGLGWSEMDVKAEANHKVMGVTLLS